MTSEDIRAIRTVELQPMRVASFHAFGKEPEMAAWRKLESWAQPKGYIGDGSHHIYGFNNPDPAPGSPNYGYEFWMEIPSDSEAEEGFRVVEFDGGPYAVLRIEVAGDAYQVIPDGWKRLHNWCEEQGLRFGRHQWLEQHVTPPSANEGFILDLHMPIVQ